MRYGQWLTKKPDFKEQCVCVAAVKIGDHWEYETYLIEKVESEDGWYMGWLTGEREEYGDLAEFKADKYFLIKLLK